MREFYLIFFLVAGLTGCAHSKSDSGADDWGGTGTPCDAYVAAICACNTAVCDEVTAQFENADADLQDECSAYLGQAESGDDPTCG